MKKIERKEGTEKAITAWLPAAFVQEFKQFAKELNKNGEGVRNIPAREIIYEAIIEYMDKKRASWENKE